MPPEIPLPSEEGELETLKGPSPEIHDQDLALTVLCVPYSLDSSSGKAFKPFRTLHLNRRTALSRVEEDDAGGSTQN